MRLTLRSSTRAVFVSLLFITFAAPSGCSKSALISGIDVQVPPNAESVKVQLNFSSDFVTDIGGTFPVRTSSRDYGAIEMQPWTKNSSFNLGFRLNTEIVNDQDYAKLNPRRDLPNGQPLPVGDGRAMAELKLANPINPNIDVSLFVDVTDAGRQWVGTAVQVRYLNSEYFPEGLVMTQRFLKDTNGNPKVVAALFGPQTKEGKTIWGGIALFANIKAIATNKLTSNEMEKILASPSKPEFSGKNADYYNTHPKEALKLKQALKAALEQASENSKK